MSFYYPEAFALLVLLIPFLFSRRDSAGKMPEFSPEMERRVVLGRGRARRDFWLVMSVFVLMTLALSRPVIFKESGEELEERVEISIALDISKSMMCEDLFPNRLELAKHKMKSMLNGIQAQKVALFAFSQMPFIISPLTENHEVLVYLTQHIEPDIAQQSGTNLLALMRKLNDIMGEEKLKAVLLFTDGGEQEVFKEEIAYAKAHRFMISGYAIGTKIGGPIKEKEQLLKDSQGEIVITRLNHTIQKLTEATGGFYREYSLKERDTQMLLESITNELKARAKMEVSDEQKQELFAIPLLLAFILLLLMRLPFRSVR